jgi:energy-coupling factor transporter ATP-binding protein EcfA2
MFFMAFVVKKRSTDTMAKIADVVKLKTGYANFVELKSAFDESQENAERMAMYRPTRAHRAAFERLSRGLFQPNDKKFYLLSGSYGTGKSHLCLMFANFLSRASGDPEIKGFYENYERLNPDMARTLTNIRKGGQYLVAICDYHSGKKFEDVVLKAVFDACQAKGLDVGVQTEFDEAQRLLSTWEEKADEGIRNFYEDFGKALEKVAPSLSVEQLRSGLKGYDSDSLEKFRSAYQETMGGTEFHAHSGNLIPIVKEITKSKAFKDRFKGLAVLFDEFGFTLEKGSYSKDVLQGFMETICKERT